MLNKEKRASAQNLPVARKTQPCPVFFWFIDSAFSIQHSAFSIQHSAFSIQHFLSHAQTRSIPQGLA
jgi:hypothetical protein